MLSLSSLNSRTSWISPLLSPSTSSLPRLRTCGLGLLATLALAGCGTGGYPGAGLTSLSRGTLVLDASESYPISAGVEGSPTVTWALGGNCGSTGCGSISGTTGLNVVYTAPAGVTTPFQATLTATVNGTQDSRTTIITVDPDPTVQAGSATVAAGQEVSILVASKGGTAPVTLSLTSTLPAGLTFNPATGIISGVPTATGTFTINAKAVDSSAVPFTATGIGALSVTAGGGAGLTLSSPPAVTAGQPYSGSIGVSGGNAPYNCVITVGSLPPGLTNSSCLITGTTTATGSYPIMVSATDASSPANTGSGAVTVTVNGGNLTITTAMLPNGTVGVAYNATIGVSGGSAPYTCTFTSGTLPSGLSLSGCTVSGTPTVAGTANLTVKATDSSNPQQTGSGPESITINPAPLVITTSMLPNGTVGVPYSATINVTGGTAPYNCTFTTGTLPAGLSVSGCVVSGTPTTPGTQNLTVKATDSGNPQQTATGPESITINPAPVTLTLTNPSNGMVNTPYNSSIGVTGGTAPYTCQITAGALPTGLHIANCTISGTTAISGPVNLTVKATDANNATTTGPVTFTIQPASPLTLSVTGGLPNATVNVPYTYTLMAQGGQQPYTYSKTAGTLPPGITLATNGVISGTPTMVGVYSFTATVTDASTPQQTASVPLVLNVLYTPGPNTSGLKGPYAFLFQGYDDSVAGVLDYQTATAGSFTADGAGGITAGELDANHQGSNPAGATVPTQKFLGSYTLGADNRGSLSITTLNPDGTVNATSVYAIAVKAPVAPATISTQGSLIEYDSNQLAGTKGSGTILAQTPSAFATGLTGSYAFGVSGDTPCLPACSIGVLAGPVAAVGEFSANGTGVITNGETDANIATTKYIGEIASGTYAAADANGRLQLSLSTSNTPNGVYPTDFAVYVVNASQAFLVSTDKHSAYILLAGSMQQQTQATFSNASMNAAFVGYENSLANPSILTTTLSNTLAFTTATLFRGVGGSNGNCNITNVNTGGTQALLNQLTGLGGSLTGLTGILGTYSATGSTTCPVIANGRGVLAYPPSLTLGIQLLAAPDPRVFYLYAPNSGYFLETGYAGVGRFEAQTGGPYSLSTFNGTFVYAMVPAASAVSTDTSGVITADGHGHETSTEDLNVGVGTINVLQLGVTGTGTYTAPDPATGVFTLNTTTYLYTINPGRFALLDTNPATTSPSVAILY